jgi:soluble lytic murein transglycosylase-like protein
MRAICPMARRMPAALAVAIGVPLWLGTPLPAEAQRAAQTASGAPAAPVPGAGAAMLPQPLAAADAARIARIFRLQAEADEAAARREHQSLRDHRLDGHILADRWLRTGAPAPRSEDLEAWLERHADHPDAPRLHALLAERAPRGASLPPAPADAALPDDGEEAVPEERESPARGFVRNPALDRTVRERAVAGDTRGALEHIRRTRGMTPAYAAALRADVALALFRRGEDAAAFRLASDVARGGRERTGRAAFAAGLAAWGLGRHEVALPYFETAARAEGGSAASRASAAFWTARAAVRARRPQQYVPWMLQAAQEPRTFHGLLARRALGLAPGFAWYGEAAEEGASALMETAGGWRALALLQVGQDARAEAELRALWPAARGNAALLRAMLAVASRAGMTNLGAQLAGLAQGADGRPRDLARFPLPQLQPAQGFRVDPALLYALARQESNFDPAAVSRAGARGLMQVMPATAAYVANDPTFRGEGAQRLHDPALSLEIGQRYLLYLARHEAVEGNLIRLLAAYNAGPGNLARWLPAARHRDDPFLFIEAIPAQETRQHVQRVLAYSWIYASRLGLPSPSLDALVRGQFPAFAPGDVLTGRRAALN